MSKSAIQLGEEAETLRLLGTLLELKIDPDEAIGLTVSECPQSYKDSLLRIRANGGIMDNLALAGAFESEKNTIPSFISCLLRRSGIRSARGEYRLGAAFIEASSVLKNAERIVRSGKDPSLVNFYRILGLLVSRDVPLLEAIESAGDNNLSGTVTQSITAAVRKGETFLSGLEHHRNIFPAIDRSLIDIGEQTGAFPEVCKILADLKGKYLEWSLSLSTLKNCLLYEILAISTNAGMSLGQSLKRLARAEESAGQIGPFQVVLERINMGLLPSEAMHSLPEYFPSLFVRMVKEGEIRGELELTFRAIADFLAWRDFNIERPKEAVVHA